MALPKFLKDAVGVLADVAPNVLGLAVGPAGEKALSGLFELLGVKNASEDEKVAKLQNLTPEERIAIIEYDKTLVQSEASDRADSRQLALKYGLQRHFILTIIILGITAFYFGSIIYASLAGSEISTTMQPLLYKTEGIIEAVLLATIFWWFGTSFSSQRKGIQDGIV